MTRLSQEETASPWWYSALTNKDLFTQVRGEGRSVAARPSSLTYPPECVESGFPGFRSGT